MKNEVLIDPWILWSFTFLVSLSLSGLFIAMQALHPLNDEPQIPFLAAARRTARSRDNRLYLNFLSNLLKGVLVTLVNDDDGHIFHLKKFCWLRSGRR